MSRYLEIKNRLADTALSALEGLIKAYQILISPFLPRTCRFHPTCSDYCRQALRKHGLKRGVVLSLKRLARCHPWNPGGFDPLP